MSLKRDDLVLIYRELEKKEANLQELKTVKRMEVAKRIKAARIKGNLSDNKEYEEAKAEQRNIEEIIENTETRIKELLSMVDTEISNTRLIHICEICGKAKIMTPEEAFNEGWDYPPRMGKFGIVSPRTCGDCGMDKTLWHLLQRGEIKRIEDLSDIQQATLLRIQNEPMSILPE